MWRVKEELIDAKHTPVGDFRYPKVVVVAGPESVSGFDRNPHSCQALPIQLCCMRGLT